MHCSHFPFPTRNTSPLSFGGEGGRILKYEKGLDHVSSVNLNTLCINYTHSRTYSIYRLYGHYDGLGIMEWVGMDTK